MLWLIFYYDYDPGSDAMGILLDNGQDPLLAKPGGFMVMVHLQKLPWEREWTSGSHRPIRNLAFIIH